MLKALEGPSGSGRGGGGAARGGGAYAKVFFKTNTKTRAERKKGLRGNTSDG